MAVQNDNAIVVTPQGVNNSWTPSTDVRFINAAADTVEAIANVNPDHVYVTGISMGGQMTVAVGCDNANRWRGMAPCFNKAAPRSRSRLRSSPFTRREIS